MKLLGYARVHGEKDDKKWDFVNLYVEKENVNPGSECGGTQLLTTYYKNRGTGFPSISTPEFTVLLHKGIRPGSDIRIYKDIDNTLHVELV